MIENGLTNVMEVIKRQKWEKLFKRRELVHVDAVKEFYAKLTMSHNRKKDVARSKVRGVEIVLDYLKPASILGIPGNNGICEYIKEVWEESRYTKPLEITRKNANDDTIMEARRVKSVEMKPFQRFIHFLVMKNVIPRFGKRDTTSYMDLIYMDHLIARRLVNLPRENNQRGTITLRRPSSPCVSSKRENGVRWIGTGENKRRGDEIKLQVEEVHEEEVQNDFDWETVIDEVTDRGELVVGEKFYDAEDENQEPAVVVEEVPAVAAQASAQQKEIEAAGVDPSGPSGHIPETVMSKLQAVFEKAHADRIQADLEKAQAENARLLALLQQAKNPPQP
ncbi:hypothetical protein Dimus_036966 [Dionaea muscipula]